MERLQTYIHLDKTKMKKALHRETHRHWDNPNMEMRSGVAYKFRIWI